jgi:hypothetical protein
MGIDEATSPLLDDFCPLRDEVQRRHGSHQAQTGQRLGRTNQGRFQLQSIGFIIQKVLLAIKPQAILLKGLAIGWFIADHIPHLLTAVRSCYGQMHGTIALGRQGHPMPETGVPLRYGEALNLAAESPLAIEPEAGLDPDAPVPAEPLKMGHQVRIGKAPIGQQHLAATRQQHCRLLP